MRARGGRDKALCHKLAAGDWIDRPHNLTAIGAPGQTPPSAYAPAGPARETEQLPAGLARLASGAARWRGNVEHRPDCDYGSPDRGCAPTTEPWWPRSGRTCSLLARPRRGSTSPPTQACQSPPRWLDPHRLASTTRRRA